MFPAPLTYQAEEGAKDVHFPRRCGPVRSVRCGARRTSAFEKATQGRLGTRLRTDCAAQGALPGAAFARRGTRNSGAAVRAKEREEMTMRSTPCWHRRQTS